MGLFDWLTPKPKSEKSEAEILKSGSAAQLLAHLSTDNRFFQTFESKIDLGAIGGTEAPVKRHIASLYNEKREYLIKPPPDEKLTHKHVGDFEPKNQFGDGSGSPLGASDSAYKGYNKHMVEQFAAFQERHLYDFKVRGQVFIDHKLGLDLSEVKDKPKAASSPAPQASSPETSQLRPPDIGIRSNSKEVAR